jgi:transposase-like protein
VYISGTGCKSITLKFHQRKRGLKYVIGETVLKVGPEYVWLWVAIEVGSKGILGLAYQGNETSVLQSDLSRV